MSINNKLIQFQQKSYIYFYSNDKIFQGWILFKDGYYLSFLHIFFNCLFCLLLRLYFHEEIFDIRLKIKAEKFFNDFDNEFVYLQISRCHQYTNLSWTARSTRTTNSWQLWKNTKKNSVVFCSSEVAKLSRQWRSWTTTILNWNFMRFTMFASTVESTTNQKRKTADYRKSKDGIDGILIDYLNKVEI